MKKRKSIKLLGEAITINNTDIVMAKLVERVCHTCQVYFYKDHDLERHINTIHHAQDQYIESLYANLTKAQADIANLEIDQQLAKKTIDKLEQEKKELLDTIDNMEEAFYE